MVNCAISPLKQRLHQEYQKCHSKSREKSLKQGAFFYHIIKKKTTILRMFFSLPVEYQKCTLKSINMMVFFTILQKKFNIVQILS